MLNQKEPQRVGKLMLTNPLPSRQRYDLIYMQLETNIPIEDSVFVDMHILEINTWKTL